MTSTQANPSFLTFEEYLNHDDGTDNRYELVAGELIEMPPPTWLHLLITKFLVRTLDQAIQATERESIWTTLSEPGQQTDGSSARLPDLAIVPYSAMGDVLKSAVLTIPAPLVVEIVSGNWRDDYLTKLAEYETLGVPEFWIVDYQGLGGTRYIGHPKQPTLSIYQLVDGEYQVNLFRQGERLQSPTFPELKLTADEVFTAGQTAKQ
ncbi:MAG: Uma2 family endonuclease [Cyanobacteria bacterium P01_A01_bin.114]